MENGYISGIMRKIRKNVKITAIDSPSISVLYSPDLSHPNDDLHPHPPTHVMTSPTGECWNGVNISTESLQGRKTNSDRNVTFFTSDDTKEIANTEPPKHEAVVQTIYPAKLNTIEQLPVFITSTSIGHSPIPSTGASRNGKEFTAYNNPLINGSKHLTPLTSPEIALFPQSNNSLFSSDKTNAVYRTSENLSPISIDDDQPKSTNPATLAVAGSSTLTAKGALIKLKGSPKSESSFDYKSKRSSTHSDRSRHGYLHVESYHRNEDGHLRNTLQAEISGLRGLNNLNTSKGRRFHAILILTISVVPLLALLIQNSITVYQDNKTLKEHDAVKGDISFSTEAGDLLHRTQIERGITALYVSSSGDQKIYPSLQEAYNLTDAVIRGLSRWIAFKEPPHFASRHTYSARINAFRQTVATDPRPTVNEVIEFYSNDNLIFEQWIGQGIRLSKSGSLWKTLVAYHMLIQSKEQAGVERALGSTYYAQGGFDNMEVIAYLERKLLGVTYLQKSQEYSDAVLNFLERNFNNGQVHKTLQRLRKEIIRNNITVRDVSMGDQWFQNMTIYLDHLLVIQNRLAADIVRRLDEEVDRLTDNLIVSVVIDVVAAVLLPFVVMSVNRLISRIHGYTNKLQERTNELDVERQRSQTLLYELLPQQVAIKLLRHEPVMPMSFNSVTIFFSDIVGFTNIASRSTPMQVIDMLNSLYRIFDDIIEAYDVYKVETIGDAYMVASGVPEANLENHAEEIAGVALDMRHNISNLMVNHLPNESLRIRIGLNSGPVVAGVVGHKMPRYCLFGDTVNVASRMESTSLPLKIQITQSTKEELEKRNTFFIVRRGQVEIKGRGSMTTYWLVKKMKDDVIEIDS